MHAPTLLLLLLHNQRLFIEVNLAKQENPVLQSSEHEKSTSSSEEEKLNESHDNDKNRRTKERLF